MMEKIENKVEKLIHVSYIGLSSEECFTKGIHPSLAHKFKGTTKDIKVFSKQDWEKALITIKECNHPLTNPSQIAWSMPTEIGKSVVTFEKAKADLAKKINFIKEF